MIELETDRLTLRTPVLDDFEAYAAMSADPKVMRYLALDGQPLSRFAAWRGFAGLVGHWTLRGYGMFSVVERATGKYVGRIGPWFPEGWPDFEIGWTLRSEYWGRGYATEAAVACLGHAFGDLDRAHVISLITPDNARSIRVAERLGETLEQKVWLPHLPPDMRVLQYGLSREAWRARNPSPGPEPPRSPTMSG